MFGKPQWFRPKTLSWGLVPVKWQGWLYAGAWGGVIGLPFLLLIGRHQPAEALAWMVLMLGALMYDVRQVLGAIRGPGAAMRAGTSNATKADDNVLYILDNEPGQPVATRNYNLLVRR